MTHIPRGVVLRRLIRELDRSAPLLAESLRWRLAVRRGGLAPRLVERLVGRGDTALDIGAHRGLFTAGLLRLVGRAGSVHAFEPNPVHTDRLSQMATRRPNLAVHAVGLSDRAGTGTLNVPVVAGRRYEGMGTLDDPGGRLATADYDPVTVTVASVDDLVDARGVSFIKCDVEGHEDRVLAGAERLLQGGPSLLVEIEQRHRGADPRSTIEWLEGYGLRGWALFEDGLRPVRAFDLERDQLAHLPGAGDGERMPPAYVNDFLFTPPGVDVAAFVAV